MKFFTTLSFLFLNVLVFAQTDCPEVTAQILGASCEGADDGLINITVNQGVSPYSFEWSNGSTSEDLIQLSPGDYTLTVTDSQGCITAFPAANPITEPLVIPDATGQSLVVPILVDQFGDDAVITSGDHFEVCVTMEHSWLRDLEMVLTCPDGTSIILHDHPGNFGGEVYMGEPNDGDEADPIPGIGYEYCWKSDAISGTILQNIKGDLQTLPAGTYSPFESFDDLIGCTVNGSWIFEIRDSWGNDNGFIFDWHLNINDGNVELMTVGESEIDCLDCQENFHCMQWLRDTITNNVDLYDWVEKANWNGRTIFMASRGDSNDGGFTSFFDCEGNLFQAFIAGFSQTYIPNPPFVTFEELTEVETIWSFEVALADCGQALTLEQAVVADVTCFGGSDGMVCAGAFGGLPPYTIHWEDENGFALEGGCISNLPAGMYALTAIDANMNSTEPVIVTIAQPEEIVINIELLENTADQNCVPYINLVGGVAPFTIAWTPEIVTDEVLVTVEDANGCTAEATAECIINGVRDIEGLTYLSLSPNPTTGHLFLQAGFDQFESAGIKVVNVVGSVVWTGHGSGLSVKKQIDLSNQPAGMYFVELMTERGRIVEPVVVSR